MRLLLPTLIIAALLTGCATQAPTQSVTKPTQKGWTFSPASATAPRIRIVPIVRIPPIYPSTAQYRGVQGCVSLVFQLDDQGHPTNLQVLASTPNGIFDRTAIQTLAMWLFRVTDMQGHLTTAGSRSLVQVMFFLLSNTTTRAKSIISWICYQPPPRTLIVTTATANAGIRVSTSKSYRRVDVVHMPNPRNMPLKDGWVKVGFCIDKAGQVTHATVQNASPKGLYDKAAIAALKTWKFTARKSWHPIKTCGLHYHIPVIGAAALARSPIVINQRPTAIRTQDLALPEGEATPLNGKVTLQFCIDKDGAVSNARAISSRPGRIFARAALRTLHVWQYWPRTVNGKPQRTCNVRKTVIFRLGHRHLVWVYSSAS